MVEGKQWAYKDGSWRNISANRRARPGETIVERINENELKAGGSVISLPTPDLPGWAEIVKKHSVVQFSNSGNNGLLAKIAVSYACIEEEYEANKDNWHSIYDKQENR